MVLPPMRAFMDDITGLVEAEDGARALLRRLDELIGWARMRFKPRNSRSLSLARGKPKSIRFEIAGEVIPQ